MTHIRVVRYTTTPQTRDENARLVSGVYEALAGERPEGLRYATLQLADAVSFLHIAVREDPADGDGPLPKLPAFQAFQRDLAARVVAPPEVSAATLIGGYRLLASGR